MLKKTILVLALVSFWMLAGCGSNSVGGGSSGFPTASVKCGSQACVK